MSKSVLITGGAGFIGSNLASRLLRAGERVVLLDNLSRPCVERNVAWLAAEFGPSVRLELGDIRDVQAVNAAVSEASSVYHFAAQVAVTTSLITPVVDFETNARGTLNVLEALRAQRQPPPLVFTSTNKVYGELEGISVELSRGRYVPADAEVRARGVSERQPLCFHSPYGCSKGAADQYVLDYARSFGLRATVYRMSCIYGPRQFGTEDQGWVAHFLMRALADEPITLYGDGRQVRDVLFIDDLVDAMLLGRERIDALSGLAFNLGGGPGNTLSLLELLGEIEQLRGKRPAVSTEAWRVGDQRYYVSDTRAFAARTGWAPKVGVREGVKRLHGWLLEARGDVARPATPPTAVARELAPGGGL